MSEEAPVQAPTDIAGVGIHLSYIRRDMAEITKKLDVIASNHVPISAHLELKADTEKRVGLLDARCKVLEDDKTSIRGKLWGIGFAITSIASVAAWILGNIFKK